MTDAVCRCPQCRRDKTPDIWKGWVESIDPGGQFWGRFDDKAHMVRFSANEAIDDIATGRFISWNVETNELVFCTAVWTPEEIAEIDKRSEKLKAFFTFKENDDE